MGGSIEWNTKIENTHTHSLIHLHTHTHVYINIVEWKGFQIKIVRRRNSETKQCNKQMKWIHIKQIDRITNRLGMDARMRTDKRKKQIYLSLSLSIPLPLLFIVFYVSFFSVFLCLSHFVSVLLNLSLYFLFLFFSFFPFFCSFLFLFSRFFSLYLVPLNLFFSFIPSVFISVSFPFFTQLSLPLYLSLSASGL